MGDEVVNNKKSGKLNCLPPLELVFKLQIIYNLKISITAICNLLYLNNIGANVFRYSRQLDHVCPPPVT